MADNFTFELVSPEKLLLSGDAEIVTIPAREGDMGVLFNHAPVMTSLRPGVVEVKMADGSTTEFFVRGGFADITPSSVTVLAEFAMAKADVTREIFDEQKRLAEEAYAAVKDSGDAEKAANAHLFVQQLDALGETLVSA